MKKIVTTIVKSILFFVGWALLTACPIPNTKNPAVWRFWAEVIPFLIIVGFTLVFWLFDKKKEKLCIASGSVRSVFVSVIVGTIWLGIVVAVLMISGTMKITGYSEVPMLWLWIISVLINTIMQELLVRGYMYQMIKLNYNIIAATVATTALFAFMHGGAFEAGIVPVLNVLTMSILMTFVLEYTQSLIAPIIMHFIWNCVGAVVLGGVSLAEDYPHVLTAEFSGNTLMSGGAPKMEGSIVVLVVNVLMIVVVGLLIKTKRKATSHLSGRC